MYRFADRADAGRLLALRLEEFRRPDTVVLGIPRGGVPVAAEVARFLEVPLDVVVVRKIGVTLQPEYAMGAVGEQGVLVLDEDVTRSIGVSDARLAALEVAERATVDRQVLAFRGTREPNLLRHRTALVVDDGIATAHAARAVARTRGADRVVDRKSVV